MLVLPSELTFVQAADCLRALTAAAQAQTASPVAVDASALTRFDSSALAVLLELRRACLSRGQTLRVQALAPRLLELAELYGVAGLLTVSDTAAARPAD